MRVSDSQCSSVVRKPSLFIKSQGFNPAPSPPACTQCLRGKEGQGCVEVGKGGGGGRGVMGTSVRVSTIKIK